jgi:hypothetical protein
VKNYINAALLSAIFVFLSSCATTEIQSNKDSNYLGKIDRLAILYDHNNIIDSNIVVPPIIEEFTKEHVTTVLIQNTGLELDSNNTDNLIVESKCTQLLVIKLVDAQYVTNNYGLKLIAEANYDVSIIDLSTNRMIWRSNINVSGDAGFSYAYDNFAISLINTLKKDSLL